MTLALGIVIGLLVSPVLGLGAWLLLLFIDNDCEAAHIREAEEMDALAKAEWADHVNRNTSIASDRREAEAFVREINGTK